MSNRALPRPRFNAPEPERGSKAALKIEATAPLLQGKVSELPDVFFGGAMRPCGLPVLPAPRVCCFPLGGDVHPPQPRLAPEVFGVVVGGIILAIMNIPMSSSSTREVLTVVPQHQREAVLALGATRWEMIRMGVLRNARAGIVGAIILGLGRALGETMAVTMVIGNPPEIAKSLFAPGYTTASVLANQFTQAPAAPYLSPFI